MKLWRLSQNINTGYDTFDAAIVAAETEAKARLLHPSKYPDWNGKDEEWHDWCDAAYVTVELIGDAIPGTKTGVILASFNAG